MHARGCGGVIARDAPCVYLSVIRESRPILTPVNAAAAAGGGGGDVVT